MFQVLILLLTLVSPLCSFFFFEKLSPMQLLAIFT
ncbi:unnamed protein product [Brassica oleracea]